MQHSTAFRILCLALVLPFATTTTGETLWESDGEYVKIVPRDGGDANRHPLKIDPQLLGQALAKLRVTATKKRSEKTLGNTMEFKDTSPLFTLPTAQRMAEYIADGLRRAGPGDDIVFRSVDTAPLLGNLIGKQVFTAGRVFWRDRRLHVVFGKIHKSVKKRWLLGHQEGYTNAPEPGKRGKASALKLRIVEAPGVSNAKTGDGRKRIDWIVIEPRTLAQAPDEAMPEEAPAKPATLNRSAKARLKRLDELRKEGLISEQEYKRKRRQVLDEL